jgi:pimeloyl-ACP methyl ester carboxylesterase
MTDAKPPLEGFEERFLEAAGRRVRYLAAGEGPPIVLVHGWGGSGSNWAELAPELARSRRVIVPELPGHGGSERVPHGSTLVPYAEAVAAVLEQEDVAPAPVVGHSLGGIVALRLALERRGAVSGLVMASPAGISSSTPQALRLMTIAGLLKGGRKVAPYRARIGRSDRLKTAAFGYWFAADPPALSARAVDGFLEGHTRHTDTDTAWRALVEDDPRSDLHGIDCPVLVLWGACDNQLPLDDAFDYARRLRAPLRVIPDCGHLLIGERPDACLDAIEYFLATHEL